MVHFKCVICWKLISRIVKTKQMSLVNIPQSFKLKKKTMKRRTQFKLLFVKDMS